MGAILAIDQGTSGTKSVVVSENNEILAVKEQSIRPQYLPGGGVEQDPEELIDSVWATAHAAVASAGVPLAGVTMTNQGETVLAWDPETGKPLSNLVVWQDSRAQGICDELTEHSQEIADATGLVLDPYFTAPKLAWLRRNVTKAGIVTTSDAWIMHALTGQAVTDVSTASRSLLTRLDNPAWDPRLLSFFGLEDEVMPRIVACDEIVGTTSRFGAPAPVGGLVVDQQGALLAQSCLQAGDAKCTFGTGAFLLANIGQKPLGSSSGLSASVAWKVDDQVSYCFDGQVYTAASAVRWMQDIGVITGPEQMDEIAQADTGGVMCVPALAGLAAPWWRSDATATLSGMTLSTTPGHIVGAVLQGIAVQVALMAELTAKDTAVPWQRLQVDGGLTRCRFLMQAVADIAQVEVSMYPSAHATPLGAVALLRKAQPG